MTDGYPQFLGVEPTGRAADDDALCGEILSNAPRHRCAFALGGSLEQHAEQRFQQLFQRHHGQ